jgi:hypothetical protein
MHNRILALVIIMESITVNQLAQVMGLPEEEIDSCVDQMVFGGTLLLGPYGSLQYRFPHVGDNKTCLSRSLTGSGLLTQSRRLQTT